MPLLTTEMVEPQMIAAQKQQDSARRVLGVRTRSRLGVLHALLLGAPGPSLATTARRGRDFRHLSDPESEVTPTARNSTKTKGSPVRRLFFIVTLVVAAAPAALAAPASATPGSPVNSTFTTSPSTMTSTRTAGGNTFVTFARTPSFSGTVTGTATDTVTVVFHSDGTTSVNGAGTCLCTVDGRTGTVQYSFEGSGIFQVSGSGHYLLDRGTGGLAGLHLEGPWTANLGWATVNLGGTYHFD